VTANGRPVGTFSSINRIIVNAGEGNDTITASGLTIPATLDGGNGADRLTGGRAGDELRGGEGDDRLTGGPGVDALFGGGGNDLLDAVDGTPDRQVDGGAGNDNVRTDPTDTKTGT
jgi:Ca2+-binding RTX toxin-like protein